MTQLAVQNYLYRALYLRREYSILADQCALHLTQPSSSPGTSNDASSSAAHMSDVADVEQQLRFRDVILLPPQQCFDLVDTLRHDGDAILSSPEHAWWGMISLTHPSSPWYGGCFGFTVCFPSRYPFECPVVELAAPLRSHPLLTQRVALEEVYCKIDPMRVSVMARLLRHLMMLFYPHTWPRAWWSGTLSRTAAPSTVLAQSDEEHAKAAGEHATPTHAVWSSAHESIVKVPGVSSHDSDAASAEEAHADESRKLHGRTAAIDGALAQEDVRRRSITQEVVIGKPYIDLLRGDVADYFLHTPTAAWLSASMERSHALHGQRGADGACSSGVHEPATDGLSITSEEDAYDRQGVARQWAAWYAREILPRMLAMP